MHIILDFVWTRVRKTLKKRLLILDEAWYIMKYPDSASFVYGIAKRSRKYYLALTTATQDAQDFLSTDYGRAILSNSSIQMLLKQSPTEIDLISKVFYLSEGEKELLLSADIGEGLFFAGQSHVAMKVIAAPFEHTLITSNPQEILNIREQEETEIKAQETTQDMPIQPIAPPIDQKPQPPLEDNISETKPPTPVNLESAPPINDAQSTIPNSNT